MYKITEERKKTILWDILEGFEERIMLNFDENFELTDDQRERAKTLIMEIVEEQTS